MSVHQLSRIEAIFHAALARPAEARDAFLAEACGDDEALRREVAELLAHAADTRGFLEKPITAGLLPPLPKPRTARSAGSAPARAIDRANRRPGSSAAWNEPIENDLRWALGMGALAGAKIVVLLLAFAVGRATGIANPGSEASPWIALAQVCAYGAMGAMLVIGGRLDRRCRELGVYFLLVACTFADVLGWNGNPLGGLTAVANTLRLDAFMPVFFWLFARDFPTRVPLDWSTTFAARAVNVSLVAGIFLAAANLLFDLGAFEAFPALHEELGRFSRSWGGSGPVYWVTIFSLMLPGTPVLLARTRHVGPGDRRRVLFFVGMLVAGLAPIGIDISLRATSATWARVVRDPSVRPIVNFIVLAALLTVPFTTAYAVMVARVADLGLVVRRALTYALARYSVIALVSLPFIALGLLVYLNRLLTVEELIFGRFALALLTGAAVAVVALRASPATLRAIDRRFFREQFDAHQILAGLVDGARRAGSSEELADLVVSEIDRALHLDRIAILIRHDDGLFTARDEATRPLPDASMLIRLMSESDDPLDVAPDDSRSVFHRLDESEQAWLADGAFRLLVPLRGAEGLVIGVLALGEKKSELPYSAEDRQLLAAVGASGGLALESRILRTPTRGGVSAPTPSARDSQAAARECLPCGRVHPSDTDRCDCGGELVAAPVPKVLAQKFRIDSRIGMGGMGVVYRATDLTLDRTVAIKTLPNAGADDTWRLRREARAMALVNHENLAMIFAAESWNGAPLLVEEFLPGGTLADRLAKGPRPIDEALALGIVLGRLLETMHGVGLLHRDIKPSNIGYAANGTVKLLDFGLAQIVAKRDDVSLRVPPTESGVRRIASLGQATQQALGTPSYMAPEAIRNEHPAVSFDLWSLSVVLLESVCGKNPFLGATVGDTIDRIHRFDVSIATADLARDNPDIAEFFETALAADKRRRPATAAEFVRRLSALRRVEPTA